MMQVQQHSTTQYSIPYTRVLYLGQNNPPILLGFWGCPQLYAAEKSSHNFKMKLGNFGHCGRFVSKYHKMFCVGTLVFGTLVVNSIAMCSNIKSTWKSCSTLLIQLKEGKAICFSEFLLIFFTDLFRLTLISHCYFTRLNLLKMGPLQFCLSIFLGIHRNPKQKEFFDSCEGFLMAALTGHRHPGPF